MATKKPASSTKAPTKKSAPAPKKTSAANKSKNRAAKRQKDAARTAKANQRKHTLSQFMPFVIFALALILLVLLVLDAISYFTMADPPLEGAIGEFVCRNVLFGLLGQASYLFPILLVVSGIYWFKAEDGVTKAIKAILSIMIIALFSSMIHIFRTPELSIENMDTNLVRLYTDSTMQQAGGLLGGYLGWVFCWAFRWASVIVVPFLLILLFCALFEITPMQVWNKIKASRAKRAARVRAAADEDDEDDYEDDDDDEVYDDDEEQYQIPIPVKKPKKSKPADEQEDAYTVDPETGEVIDLKKKPRKPKKSKRTVPEDDDDDIGFKPLNLSGDDDLSQDPNTSVPFDGELDTAPVTDSDPAGEWENDAFDPELPMDEIEVDLEDDYVQDEQPDLRRVPDPEPDVFEDELFDDAFANGEPTQEDADQNVYVFPTTDMLAAGNTHYHTSEEEMAANTEVLRQTLEDFNIKVKEVSCSCGPTVTRYEVKPEAGVRVRSIANLVDDISLGLAKSGVRIEAPIPGKAAVGIEVPNDKPATVYLRNLLESPEFVNHKSKVAVCLGADVSGKPVVFDIEKMPHLLVAGATGMGKSVCINCLVMSLLYKARPDEVKLIMVDPKKVEFTMYRDIPHLYCPIVSDPKKAAGALASAVSEMERRFSLIEEVGVRNITGYNEITKDDPEKEYLPRIVIIIDELADLMMTAPDDVETCICRLAQKARAAGIHIIIGTQRPSVDVVTGLIKANIPSRIAFTVSSQVDSRTIIDVAGAEKLIGRGDMLYAPVGAAKPQRVQGAFVSDGEVERVVSFVKTQNGSAKYNDNFTKQIEEEAGKVGTSGKKGTGGADGDFGGDSEDDKLWEAVEVVVTEGKASTSMLQRYLKVGYGRAAGLLDRMEELGIISAQDGNKPRRVLVTKSDLDELRVNGKMD